MADKCEPSGSLPAGASPSSRTRRDSEGGFTLVEVIVAAMILVVGLLSLAQLLVVTIRAESLARNGAEATRLAQGQLDELMKADFTNDLRVQVSPGDTLASNVPNYFVTTGRSTVRWRVSPGPAIPWGPDRPRIIQVRVFIAQGSTTMRMIDLTSLLRRW